MCILEVEPRLEPGKRLVDLRSRHIKKKLLLETNRDDSGKIKKQRDLQREKEGFRNESKQEKTKDSYNSSEYSMYAKNEKP